MNQNIILEILVWLQWHVALLGCGVIWLVEKLSVREYWQKNFVDIIFYIIEKQN